MTTSNSNSLETRKAAWSKIQRDSFDIATDVTTGSYLKAKPDGQLVFYNVWKPKGPIQAEVLFFHGVGEHCMRYGHVFQPFADAGILVRAIDWRGHGRTVKKNVPTSVDGYPDTFDQVFQDMLQVYAIDIDGVPKDLPLFVFGHSMGGLLALSFVQKCKTKLPNLRGCIAQAPALGTGGPFPFFQQLVVNSLGGAFGKISRPNGLILEGLCSDDAVIEAYIRDPLNHGVFTFRLIKEMAANIKTLMDDPAKFTTPLVMYHSTRDRFTVCKASEKFFNGAGSTDKRFKAFPEEMNLEHEIHNEPSVNQSIIDDYIAWIHERAV